METERLEEALFDPRLQHYLWVLGMVVLLVSVLGIPLLVIWIPGGYFWVRGYFRRLSCFITPTHLVYVRGFGRQKTVACSFESIRRMVIESDSFLNLFGLKSLAIEFEDANGRGLETMRVTGVSNTRGFRNMVQCEIDKLPPRPQE